LVEVLDRVTMQLFVRGNCTMIAAPVQSDVDGIPKGSHYVLLKRANATAQPPLEAEATQERTLPAVGCSRLILIEAPSSAYRRGMLALGKRQHAKEEETS
jgi:hypothetical protein